MLQVKLLLFDRIPGDLTRSLLCQLLLLFSTVSSPAQQAASSNAHTAQCLAVFFPAYMCASAEHADIISSLFVPVVAQAGARYALALSDLFDALLVHQFACCDLTYRAKRPQKVSDSMLDARMLAQYFLYLTSLPTPQTPPQLTQETIRQKLALDAGCFILMSNDAACGATGKVSYSYELLHGASIQSR